MSEPPGVTPAPRWAIALLAVCAAALAARANVVAAAEGGVSSPWSEPLLISGGKFGGTPDVIADRAGGVHAFWTARMSGSYHVAGCRPLEDGCRALEAVTAPVPFGAHRWACHAVAVDAAGALHVVWRGDREIAHQSRSTADPAGRWSRVQRVGWGVFPAVAAGPDGVVHLAHDQVGVSCPTCSEIVYRRSVDGGGRWSPPVTLSGTAELAFRPEFAPGPEGDVYLFWEEGRNPETGGGTAAGVGVVVSHDSGLSWESLHVFGAESRPPALAPAVAVDRAGVAVLVYRRGDGIRYRRSLDRGRTWSEEASIEAPRKRRGGGESDRVALAADSAGSLHLLATGRLASAPAGNAVHHLVWDAGAAAWSAPVIVATTTGVPDRPRLAVAEGNRLHAVWDERGRRDRSEGAPDSIVLWSTTRVAAPAVPPVPYARPAPRWVEPETAARAFEAILALLIVGAVVALARRHDL